MTRKNFTIPSCALLPYKDFIKNFATIITLTQQFKLNAYTLLKRFIQIFSPPAPTMDTVKPAGSRVQYPGAIILITSPNIPIH